MHVMDAFDVSEKSTVEFAQVASSDSASADYIIHLSNCTLVPQHLSRHRCRLLCPLIQTLNVLMPTTGFANNPSGINGYGVKNCLFSHLFQRPH